MGKCPLYLAPVQFVYPVHYIRIRIIWEGREEAKNWRLELQSVTVFGISYYCLLVLLVVIKNIIQHTH